MAANLLLPIDYLRECFRYEPDTGRFWWKQRPLRHFETERHWRSWNAQWAGLETLITVNGEGYLRGEVRQDGRRFRLAAGRVAFAFTHGYWPETVDHINGDFTDNREVNLRAATNQQQQWNQHRTTRPDKLRGAFWEKGRWAASVNQYGRKIRLGRFDTEQEAHAAYCAFVRQHRGEFANTGGLATPTEPV